MRTCSFQFFVLAVVLALPTFAGGRPESTVEPDHLIERLTVGDTRVLDSLRVTEGLLRELSEMDPMFPMVLGEALNERELPHAAERAFEHVYRRSDLPWRAAAATGIAETWLRRGNYLIAADWGRKAIETGYADADGWFTLGEALYQSEQDEDLERVSAEIISGSVRPGTVVTGTELFAEAHLWRTVVAARGDRSRFPKRMLAAFTEIPANEIHRRLYLYAFYRPELLSLLNADERNLVEAVYRAAISEHTEALRLLGLVDPAVAGAIDGVGLTGLGNTALQVFLANERYEQGAEWSDKFADALIGRNPDSVSVVSTWRNLAIARLQAASGDYPAAAERYRVVLSADAVEDRERGRIIAEYVAVLGEIEKQPSAITRALNVIDAESSVYATLVEERMPEILRAKEWDEVRALYEAIPLRASAARARVLVILALMEHTGVLSVPSGDNSFREQLAQLPQRPEAGSYFAVMFNLVAGSRGDQDWLVSTASSHSVGAGDAEISSDGAVAIAEPSGRDLTLASARFSFGRLRSAYSLWWDLAATPETADDALDAARAYASVGWTSEALSLARRAVERGGAEYNREDVPMLFPSPLPHEIEAIAAEFDVERELLYAIIREESHFNRDAVSPAGAQGLMQLMDPTAQDMMRRIDRDVSDVFHPESNLTLGTEFLTYLTGHLPNRVSVIAAYNAGLGRLRQWNRDFGDLPAPLFIEAIPFPETRNYVRKVLRSYAVYRHLGSGAPPRESLAFLF